MPKSPTPQITQTQVLVGLLVVAAFVIGILMPKDFLSRTGSSAYPTADPQTTATPAPGQKVSVSLGHLPFLGSKDAKVEVVEFGDFQCPFCGKYYTEVEKTLIKDYVNTGKVKFAFRHFAFLGQESNFAAEASECANEQGKFWDYHNYIYENQAGENQGAFAKDKLKSFAATLGLNTSQFNSCLDSGKYTKNVTDDTEDGRKAGVTGTPSTFVNGQIVVGAVPFSTIKTVLDAELSK